MAQSERDIDGYNYETFTRTQGAAKSAEFKTRLRAGEEAPDFELSKVNGEKVKLSEFRGQKHVLLEFGSIT